jgi:hypothetical protein
MTYCRKTLNVKREAFLVKRISFRSLDGSRFTVHERRDYSQAGR